MCNTSKDEESQVFASSESVLQIDYLVFEKIPKNLNLKFNLAIILQGFK